MAFLFPALTSDSGVCTVAKGLFRGTVRPGGEQPLSVPGTSERPAGELCFVCGVSLLPTEAFTRQQHPWSLKLLHLSVDPTPCL